MPKLTAHRPSQAAPRLRIVWVALAFMFFTVQLGLPAHEAGHPIGQTDTTCQFCMLGGHAPAMSNPVLAIKLPQFTVEAPRLPAQLPVTRTPFRTHHSRGPPHTIDA